MIHKRVFQRSSALYDPATTLPSAFAETDLGEASYFTLSSSRFHLLLKIRVLWFLQPSTVRSATDTGSSARNFLARTYSKGVEDLLDDLGGHH